MKVNGQYFRTVWFEDSSVFYIEQNLLPFEFAIQQATDYRECCHAIRTMMIRGAGAIGAMAGFAMALAAIRAPVSDRISFLRNARKEIESTRPTARNLFHATAIVYEAALISAELAVNAANDVADRDAEDSRMIGIHAQPLIRGGMRIETHCNAGWLAFVDHGTALSPVYQAHDLGKNPFVYVDETRPRNQGSKLTAWELNQAGIPHAIIPDNAGAWLMALGKIDMVITGADRIALNGDTANKIGTLEKAICAREYGIPFYIAAPTSTFDAACSSGSHIPIEERPEEEVLFCEGSDALGNRSAIRISSPGSPALNPAFDVTPARYITGIITEKGIITPNETTIRQLLNL